MIDVAGYDFLDLGTGHGGCYDFARARLGGKNGVGIEYLKHRVDALRKRGYTCHLGDITKVTFPKKAVRFTTISHVLEHLPTLLDVSKVIKSAVDTSKEFVFIEGPSFDFDQLLGNSGLKFYWLGWDNHPSSVTTTFIKQMAKVNKVHSYDLLVEQPLIKDSTSVDLIPLKTKKYLPYTEELHGSKPFVRFDPPIFRSFVFYLWLKPHADRTKLLMARKKFALKESGGFA